jgi:tetratricopeptide (TPR) repeat protein
VADKPTLEPVGELIARVRREQGRSQSRLAALLNERASTDTLTRHEVSRWERGERTPTDWLPHLSPVLGVPLEELERSVAIARQQRRAASADAGGSLSGIVEPGNESDRPADASYVTAIRQTNQELITLDSRYGGNDVYQLAMRAFRTAHKKLGSGAYAPAIERDLEAAVGETGEIAAWIAYDADQQDASRQVIHEAMLLSRLAGDRGLELFELSHLAMLALHLRRSREALRIAEDITENVGLSPRVSALFELRRGRALAQLDARAPALSALDKAEATLSDGITSRDPEWTWWVDSAEIAWHRGIVHAELGEWLAAVELFNRAAELRAPRGTYAEPSRPKGRAAFNDLAHLLEALIRAQAWQEGEPVITEMIGQASAIGSARTTHLLVRVIRRIQKADGATSTLTDAATDLRRILAA